MKIVVDAESQAQLGYCGNEAVQALLSPLFSGVNVREVTNVTYIHPTVTELLPFVIAEAL